MRCHEKKYKAPRTKEQKHGANALFQKNIRKNALSVRVFLPECSREWLSFSKENQKNITARKSFSVGARKTYDNPRFSEAIHVFSAVCHSFSEIFRVFQRKPNPELKKET